MIERIFDVLAIWALAVGFGFLVYVAVFVVGGIAACVWQCLVRAYVSRWRGSRHEGEG